MFLGSKIAQQRKEKNITQTDLAKDICTQNTISKIEKHNVPPTTKILIKICQRIDLTLNDVFSDFTRPNSEIDSQLTAIEKDLYNFTAPDLSAASKQLGRLSRRKLTDAQAIQMEFLNAFLQFRQGDFEDAIFECDKVLASTHSNSDNIYTVLAYTLKGASYKKIDKISKADYYFNIVLEFVENHDKNAAEFDCHPIQSIFICNQLSKYYVLTEDYHKTMNIVNIGIKLNDEINTTYFMQSLFHTALQAGQGLNLEADLLKKYEYFANLFKEYNHFDNSEILTTK